MRSPTEEARREAAIRGIDRFCASHGFDTPPLIEIDCGDSIMIEGESPDGRKFRLGYKKDIA